MLENKLAKLIREKKPSLGGWINLTDPGIAIIMARAGYDWLLIDNEHHPFTETQIQAMIYALRTTGVTSIIRVRGNDPSHIKWVLDTGAGGIMVPMLENAQDVKKAISYSKYFPLGNRGYSPLRATDFWAFKQEYEEKANREVLLICQIEQPSAVNEIEEIVKLPVDGVWIGYADLSYSMGYHGNFKHPEVQKAIDKVIDAANKYNKPWGMPAATPEDFALRVKQGALLMIAGSDVYFLNSGATERVRQCRKAIE
ncbi:MAG TPA: aldolase/citrate lyase family protein [bacterium]|nr:aldolase/citrate lyase family protein [bacterium]HOL49066.1 aldolase/citrate lyase family protein [bacterium]HPO52086.1 aldolase/citrate lyase family protein [bacterium]